MMQLRHYPKNNIKESMLMIFDNTWFEWITRPLTSLYIVGTTCNVHTSIVKQASTQCISAYTKKFKQFEQTIKISDAIF